MGVVRFVGVCALASVLLAGRAFAVGGSSWSPPVSGRVVRGFDPPRSQFGPGHFGVDYAVAPGTAVRAAGDGVVVFAGRVGQGLHVVIAHDGDIRTTDSFLATVAVVVGQRVGIGAIVGTSGGTGPGHPAGVLHFGVRVGAEYVDPMLLFTAPDLAEVVHLAPPRYGAAARAPAASPRTVEADRQSERSAIAAGLRVDARGRAPAPVLWSRAGGASPFSTRATAPTNVAPRGVASRSHPTNAATAPWVAGMAGVGGAAALGGLAALRRRRRSADPAKGGDGASDYTAPRPGICPAEGLRLGTCADAGPEPS